MEKNEYSYNMFALLTSKMGCYKNKSKSYISLIKCVGLVIRTAIVFIVLSKWSKSFPLTLNVCSQNAFRALFV